MADVPSSSTEPVTANEPEKAPKMMKIKLETSDGHVVEVDQDVAFKSNLLQKIIGDLGITEADDPRLEEALPVHDVTGPILEKLLVYCEHYKDVKFVPKLSHEDQRVYLTLWEEEYVKVSDEELTALLLGANYLDIPGVSAITTQKIANKAQGMTVEELRAFFNLTHDFSPEKEADLREKFSWIDY